MSLLETILPTSLQRRLGWLDADTQAASVITPQPAPVAESKVVASDYEPDEDPPTEEEAAQFQAALAQYIASEPEGGSPVMGGGRSSVPENQYGLLPNSFQPIATDYPFPVLTVLENLSIFNKHLSYAVDNVITLGLTELDISFSDKLSEKEVQDMRNHLVLATGRWAGVAGGESSMISNLFAQVATFGCVSAEVVVKKNLTGVDYVPRVAPRTVRFFTNDKTGRPEPYQEAPGFAGTRAGYKPLNLNTYKYITVRNWKDTPYPVPPFIAALEDLFTEKDMLDSFRSMMRRMGMLGFLAVLLKQPKRDVENEETREAYQNRLLRYLDAMRPQMEKSFSQGVALGYTGAVKFELQGNQMNSQGAAELLQIVKSGIFAGLHQDPNMLGENKSTTETFGRVILAKMTAQMGLYQAAVASFLEHLYLTELQLAGFKPGYVKCEFQSAMVGDVKRDEEVQAIRIRNVVAKRNEGIISQPQAAQELGYDQPHQKDPPAPAPLPGTPPVPTKTADRKDGKESTGSGNPSADKKATTKNAAELRAALPALLRKLGAYVPAYDYAVPASCDTGLSFEDEAAEVDVDPLLTRYQARYQNEVLKRFGIALRKTREPLRRGIVALDKTATVQQLQDTVLYHLARNWQRDFITPVGEVAAKYAGTVYRRYRRDQSVFTTATGFSKGGNFFTVPDATFGLVDYRAIEYLSKADKFYLGKFVVDPDTRQRIMDFVAREYLGKNSPIGKGQDAITAFLDLYVGQVQLEAYKIRRITETTAAKARNYANLAYIAQAELEEFEIVEVDDQRTCDYCRHMNGKTFSTEATTTRLAKLFVSDPEDVPKLTPFATTIPLDEFKKLSADQLLAKGIHAPTYHAHCRGRMVAVI